MIATALTSRRMRYVMPIMAILLLVALLLMLPVSDAFASGGGSGGSGGGEGGNCPGKGLLERIVPCITKAMEQSTYELTTAMSNYLMPIAHTFVIFVIIVYGIKILSPEGNPQKTAIPLLIKIGFVYLFIVNFGGFIPAVHGGLKEIIDILANAISIQGTCDSGSGGGGGGSSGGGGGAAAMGSDKVWTAMDCILGKLMGFAGSEGNSMLIASVFGLMAGFFFGGSFGLIAFFGIVGLLWGVLMFVFKAAFAFLNGFMLACFAVIISPLFIPLLLMQAPSQYFKGWYELLLGAFIMPLLVVGYCIFALSIYNKVLFEGERAATIRKTMDKAFSESITGMRTECLGTLLNNIIFRLQGGSGGSGSNSNALKSPSVPNLAIPQQSGGQGLCIKVPNIEPQKLIGQFKNKQEFFRKIFTDGMALFLLAWLLLQGLQTIIEVSRYLAKSGAGSLMTALSSVEKRLQVSMRNAKQRMMDSMTKEDGSSVSGPDFIRKLPDALRGGIFGMRE